MSRIKKFTSSLLIFALMITFVPEKQVNAANVPTLKLGGYEITTKDAVLESKQVKILVQPQIYVPKSLLKDVQAMMKLIEDTTKLSFYPTGNEPKVVIDVQRFDKPIGLEYSSAGGNYHGVYLSPGDILLMAGERMAIVHELLHCIYFRNSNNVSLSTFMIEGFSTYFSSIILDGSNEFYTCNNVRLNYQGYDAKIMESNAESYFVEGEGWDAYLLGFRFYDYLQTQVGDDSYQKIIAKSKSKFPLDKQATQKETIQFVKVVFGKNIFKNFGAWYEKNAEHLFSSQPVSDLSMMKTVTIYPFINMMQFYYNLNFTYDKYIWLDYSKGFEYLQKYIKQTKVLGLYGSITVSQPTTLKFYDQNKVSIETMELLAGETQFAVPRASKICVIGDGSEVLLNMDYYKVTDTKEITE